MMLAQRTAITRTITFQSKLLFSWIDIFASYCVTEFTFSFFKFFNHYTNSPVVVGHLNLDMKFFPFSRVENQRGDGYEEEFKKAISVLEQKHNHGRNGEVRTIW